MASVTSLDKDLRKLRLDKYTPGAANEVRQWIEGVLGERVPGDDLLESLKDGVALCKLINLAVGPPGVKFKKSPMPFVQMENISHFLRACQAPPLNLQEHDMFLTVDLYEQKDPAQVLQCIGAFSRAASTVKPSIFPTAIGPRSARGGAMSPQPTGPTTPTGLRARGMSNASNNPTSLYGRGPTIAPARTGDSGSGRWSPTKSPTQGASSPPPATSSWSKREHEGATSPAWNIAQYGYMGGASQGNLGIAFGGRRQITTAGPHVPSKAEKEKKRKEQEAEAERQRQEEERQRQAEIEAEEARARIEEERRWEEETRRIREEERRKIEEEKRRWEEEERQWKLTEEKRRREEAEAETRLKEERQNVRNTQLRGQYLSQYQADQESSDKARIRELEKQLEQARQREADYERGRQGDSLQPTARDDKKARSRSRSRPAQPVSRQDSWSVRDERNFLASQWTHHQPQLAHHDEEPDDDALSPPPLASPRPLPNPVAAAPPPAMVKTHRTGEALPMPPVRKQHTGSRPLPDPADAPPALPVRKQHTGSRPLPDPSEAAPALPVRKQHTGSRPLPDPTAYSSPDTSRAPRPQPAPAPPKPQQQKPTPSPRNLFTRPTTTTPQQQTTPTPAANPSRAPKSLLEREMELERQRQQEWEESQKETAAHAAAAVRAGTAGDGVDGIGGGVGGRWDVSQWTGYTGGDGQNKGGVGIGFGAGRRQIVGPRPLPNPPR
ncbi:hypothetical protein C8A05DRAFT_15835 [Staphylotrichum tortipilum]|uniref:Calponin-homology (CH) domain-containing protein n=1 Tax=Staphylotrichum tortipilum TaxID=2831512 RepID=A0AAN6MK91_9PEZI|nr:hypothetical protein C8A05DRAFT_15835 [Staphylotrichum longicolle]